MYCGRFCEVVFSVYHRANNPLLPFSFSLSLLNRRGSYEARPPPLKRVDQYWPGRDRKYADLTTEQIPMTESLKDCMERTAPIWEDRIQRELRQGRNVMVVGHANTLRGLVKTIDEIDDEDIQGT